MNKPCRIESAIYCVDTRQRSHCVPVQAIKVTVFNSNEPDKAKLGVNDRSKGTRVYTSLTSAISPK